MEIRPRGRLAWAVSEDNDRRYANSDDALLLWSVDELDDRCRGFAIQRKLKRGDAAFETRWLDNMPSPESRPISWAHQPSNEWPFRSFICTEHEVGSGDTVCYRAVPVLDSASTPSLELATERSEAKTLGAAPGARWQGTRDRGAGT